MYLYTREVAEKLDTYISQLVFAWAFIFLLLALIAVAARLYCRRLKGNWYGLDDWLIVAATVVYTAQAILVFLSVFIGGVGHRLAELKSPETEAINLLKIITAIQYPYGISMGLIRVSICVLLHRVFGVSSAYFRYAVYFGILIATAQGLFVVLDASFICKPFAANWNKELLVTDPHAKCGDSNTSFIQIVGWGIACDVYIFLLPILPVIKLQIARAYKMLLIGVFALGLVDVIVAVFRILAITVGGLDDPDADVTTTVAQGMIWGSAEPCIAILVACGPLMKPLLERVAPQQLKDRFSSLFRSQKSGSGSRSTTNTSSKRKMMKIPNRSYTELGDIESSNFELETRNGGHETDCEKSGKASLTEEQSSRRDHFRRPGRSGSQTITNISVDGARENTWGSGITVERAYEIRSSSAAEDNFGRAQ